MSRQLGARFPWGLLIVNLVGSFLLGVFAGMGAANPDSWTTHASAQAFVVVGFCGGLTTFSAFSLENLQMASKQSWGKLAWHLIGSIGLCGLVALLGYFAVGGAW